MEQSLKHRQTQTQHQVTELYLGQFVRMVIEGNTTLFIVPGTIDDDEETGSSHFEDTEQASGYEETADTELPDEPPQTDNEEEWVISGDADEQTGDDDVDIASPLEGGEDSGHSLPIDQPKARSACIVIERIGKELVAYTGTAAFHRYARMDDTSQVRNSLNLLVACRLIEAKKRQEDKRQVAASTLDTVQAWASLATVEDLRDWIWTSLDYIKDAVGLLNRIEQAQDEVSRFLSKRLSEELDGSLMDVAKRLPQTRRDLLAKINVLLAEPDLHALLGVSSMFGIDNQPTASKTDMRTARLCQEALSRKYDEIDSSALDRAAKALRERRTFQLPDGGLVRLQELIRQAPEKVRRHEQVVSMETVDAFLRWEYESWRKETDAAKRQVYTDSEIAERILGFESMPAEYGEAAKKKLELGPERTEYTEERVVQA